jgi:thiol-disulfide isomerase/thioredoxin
MRKSTRTNLTALAIIFLVNAAVYYETYQEKHRPLVPVDMTDNAPNFIWHGLDGKTHNFSELAGHVVVIHFWAAWCGPCRREFPDLLAAAPALQNDVIFLTVSGDEHAEDAKRFIESAQKDGAKPSPNVLFAWDPKMDISMGIFQTGLFPESIVVDAKGEMRRKFIGPVAWGSKPTQDYLRDMKKKE